MEETAKVFIDIEPDPYRHIPTNDHSGSRVIMKGMDGTAGNKRKLLTCGRTSHLYLLEE